MIKGLSIAFIMFLVAYPIIELTRIIIVWEFVENIHTNETPLWVFSLEIAAMWVCYLGIIPILKWRLRT